MAVRFSRNKLTDAGTAIEAADLNERRQLALTVAATAVAVLAAVWNGEKPFWQVAFWIALFVLIAAIDLRTRLILNVLTYPAIVIAVAAAAAAGIDALLNSLRGGLVFGGIFFLFFAFGLVLSQRVTVFGFGDVKMALLVGLVTGYPLALVSFYACVLIGALVSLALMFLRIRVRRQAIPYGPYIAAGGIVALTTGSSLLHWWLG
jgi:leader peptidase (prepilin peptidase)/N-methyltransferase